MSPRMHHIRQKQFQALVVQRVDIHRIKQCPADKCCQNKLGYPLDSDLLQNNVSQPARKPMTTSWKTMEADTRGHPSYTLKLSRENGNGTFFANEKCTPQRKFSCVTLAHYAYTKPKTTVGAPLTGTLVNGQLYLRRPSQNPFNFLLTAI